jgi:NAD-reducing hydrogenase small subunit
MNTPSEKKSSTKGKASASKPKDKPQKKTLATTWLDGCSGCHMSFLDLDQRLFQLAELVDVVFGPLVDAKVMPPEVDIGILEGAVSTAEDLEKAHMMRKHCKFLISLGDCAITANIPSMRNQYSLDEVLARAFEENVQAQPQIPTVSLPTLLDTVVPVHAVVPVDLFVPGCPPSADAIWFVITELLAGRVPNPSQVTRFGA